MIKNTYRNQVEVLHSSHRAFHIHTIRLPDGDRAEDWWICDGHWSQTPVADAVTLPGRYAISGMVDAHTHLSMDMGIFGLPEASDAVIEANVQDKLRQGVTAVRDAGALPQAAITSSSSDRIRIISTGKMIAPPERGYPGICVPVAEDHLIDFALREISEGHRWIKIMADFPFPVAELNYYRSVPTYSFDALQRLCKAVHEKGARVAVHSAVAWAAECVHAGVDSIEHGPALTSDALTEMAQRGIAWVPTLTTVAGVGEFLSTANVPAALQVYARDSLRDIRALLPIAEKLGVTIMAGTDEHPNDFAGEVRKLHDYGLSTRAALHAAADAARAFLGLSAWQEGAPAEVALFEDDPREQLEVLGEPVAVVA
jgi:imidazolonepropionase-like amidohydrolase